MDVCLDCLSQRSSLGIWQDFLLRRRLGYYSVIWQVYLLARIIWFVMGFAIYWRHIEKANLENKVFSIIGHQTGMTFALIGRACFILFVLRKIIVDFIKDIIL